MIYIIKIHNEPYYGMSLPSRVYTYFFHILFISFVKGAVFFRSIDFIIFLEFVYIKHLTILTSNHDLNHINKPQIIQTKSKLI